MCPALLTGNFTSVLYFKRKTIQLVVQTTNCKARLHWLYDFFRTLLWINAQLDLNFVLCKHESAVIYIYVQHFLSNCLATLLHCKLKAVVARITVRVSERFVAKQNSLLQVADSRVYFWSVVCKQRWRPAAHNVESDRFPIYVWAYC